MPVPTNLTITGLGAGSVDVSMLTANLLSAVGLGNPLAVAAQALPQTATATLATVAGGLVELVSIYGYVTTVIQTQACNLKLQSIPTIGGVAVDLCANLNISALAVGKVLAITGTVANAMAQATYALRQAGALILAPGTLSWITDASNTGAVRWIMRWRAIDPGATLS